MFSYQVDIYEKQNGAWGWYTLTGWTRPFTDGTRLDETLDSGTINLSCVTRQKAIKPFTRLRFIVSENGTEKERIYRLVASARRTRRKYANTPLYDWTINTIELTKLLERRLIDTMTVTKKLGIEHVYDNGILAVPEIGGTQGSLVVIEETEVPTYQFLTTKGTTITIPKSGGFYQSGGAPSWLTISGFVGINYKGAIVGNRIDNVYGTTLTSAFWSSDNATADNSLAYTFDEEGTYRITTFWEVYITQQDIDTGNPSIKGSYTWTFSVYAQSVLNKTSDTISSVCERLLSAGVTRRKGIEAQEFLLDPAFASEYDEILAPEFSFTNCTLFEALLHVGGYIHSIPRLVPRSISDDTRYYVTFDKLGGDEQAPTMPSLIYSESTIDVNDWCGQIDTPAQNLVNTEEVTGGSITELGNSFITVRTEDGQVEINADDVIIRVSKPIQQVVSVECGFVDGTLVGDITPYVYESAEYKTLSSYWGTTYPYSKAWAIYYTQGGNTINGLTFRWNDKTSVQEKYANYAIINIINAVTGKSLDWKDTDSGQFMRKLAFRVTYVPIAQARVKAHKPSLAEGGTVNNALTYNQSANIAETSYYGEKMRGAIARLGHDVETRTYDIFHYDQLPKVGQMLDGKYIAHIDYEWDITKVRITVALTKDFNMLSQFVGLNSNYRLYDISEKQSVERNVNYDEFIVIGDAPAVDMSQYLMLKNPATRVQNILDNGKYAPKKMSVCRLTPYDADGNEITNRAVVLPAVAFPFGTSIGLNVSYFDNYGAGYQQTNAFSDQSAVGMNRAVQRLVPYTDALGEIACLKVTFDNTTGWAQSSASAYDDGSPAMLYPQLTTADTGSQYVTTGDYLLNVQKDSREILNFTYQLHFVTTRPSIVISSGISKYCDLAREVETPTGRTYVLWLKRTINGLKRYIDLQSGEQSVYYGGGSIESNKYVFSGTGHKQTCPISDAKAYAVCKETGSTYNTASGTSVYFTADDTAISYAQLVDAATDTKYVNNNWRSIASPRIVGVPGETAIYNQASTSTTIKLNYLPMRNLSFICYGQTGASTTNLLFDYDDNTNTVSIDNNGVAYDNYIVEYYLDSQFANGTVYVKTSDCTIQNGRFELIFGENIELAQNAEVPAVYFAGAIPQACLQDAPTRLMFAPIGTPYYNDNLQRVGTLASPAIVDFDAPHPTFDAYYEIHIDGTRYYVHGDFEDELISAYDFE